MSRVYLVRHGTHDLVGKALAGRMPGVVLSDAGRQEAERLAGHLAAAGIAATLSSPLERCRETAQPLADRLGLTVTVDPDLNELDCGAWTGQPFDALAGDPRWQAWNSERDRAGIPGGETIGQVRARVQAVLDRLASRDDGPTVLVTHSDVVKVAVLTLLGGRLAWHDRLDIDPASITTLDLWPGGGKVVRLNERVS